MGAKTTPVQESGMLRKQLFATKSLKVLLDEMAGDHRLRRALGPVTLTALGIGAVIGAGIFVATGEAAHTVAGTALMASYMVAGVTCIFAAICYAEFASMPVAGKRIHVRLHDDGRAVCLDHRLGPVLEYAVGRRDGGQCWSSYFQKVLGKLGSICRSLSAVRLKFKRILPACSASLSQRTHTSIFPR